MVIENHKEQVPFGHYEKLFREADATQMAERSGAKWDGEKFYVNLLGRSYAISHPEYAISPNCVLPVQTFLLRFLLEGKAVSWGASWKTFREMPWGELYIKPYTGRVLTRAAFTFGTRVEAFAAACEKMGATKLTSGDAGYEFQFIGNYKMRILVWAGDEEFPPNAQILYSDNFETGFQAEDRVVAGDILISVIKSNM